MSRAPGEAADSSPEAQLASDKKYTQFWWKLMFELGIVVMILLCGVYAGT